VIQVIVRDEQRIDPSTDELGRDRVGYKPGMSGPAMYDANHGCWVVGPAGERERYVLFVHSGVGIQAIEVERVERVPSGRAVFHGTILEAGHPVYDRYVGKAAPNQNVRNPVTYVRTDLDQAMPCRCGCGELVSGKPFVRGHDQTALHNRVRRIGTVSEFLDWFDNLAGPFA
jgi:hypothetical protein